MTMTRTALAILALMIATPASWAAEVIDINLGYSHVVRPAEVPGTVIVGDDAIADATIGGGNTVILTAKALGATNLIILDGTGSEILSAAVTVAPVDRRSSVRVVRGSAEGQEYLCEPDGGCKPVKTGSGAAEPTVVAGASTEPAPEVSEAASQEDADESSNP